MYKEKTIPVVVKEIHQETPNVKRFTLAPLDGWGLPSFSGGSNITTYIEGNSGLLERHYSITSHPDNRQYYQIAIGLSDVSTGGSLYWHQHVKIGDRLKISYPKNHFSISFKAKHHVFYAAGIGITPFISMMADLDSSFELHYTAKSKEKCAFYDYLQQNYPQQCKFYFSQGEGAKRLSADSLLEHKIGTHAYFCGPESFITAFTDFALKNGYPSSSIHFERFTSPRPKSANSFQVQVSNGLTVDVLKDQTLLEALLEAGVKAPFSCRVGSCGTCALKVIEGEVDHYDSFLSEKQKTAQNVILSCVSRAKSEKLVIDL
ncbi:PDR/VanB family oxidoreductase [Neobacillus pocheonensis]|uniref:PDR/VanB family oxidoreductase n=1 Tax=Neobacillus pocheonensis TaxID=363869 RepID=UPI003D2A3B6D